MTGHREPSAHTRERHAVALAALPPDDGADARNAVRGLVAAAPEDLEIRTAAGRVVWSLAPYAFLREGEAPETVHPSLWRIARLNLNAGLYEVAEGVYQVRGYDLSNMALIEGDRGVVVVDPLISVECAAAALALYREQRGGRPVTGVLYTHSHVDHFGGVRGVVDEDDVGAGRVPIWAPERLVEYAASENVLAGGAMARRAGYMYGAALPRGAHGQVDAAIGKTTSTGTVTLIAPTHDVTHTGQLAVIDGVEFEFQMVPETEAPAEVNFLLPERRALCVVETASHTLHNVLTIRGAQVRDALWWSKTLNEAIDLFAGRADVVFAGHHWPTWGTEAIAAFLAEQRDLYRYIHDQTLRLANAGLTGPEIAEAIEPPPALRDAWHARGYYGSLRHNSRAVYQRYLGVYDGNPVNLDPLAPEDAGRRYVEALGGAEAVVALAREALGRGDERWAATLASHAVFADGEDAAAREMLAEALEQLGYQAENATWRNAYLVGAHELREGIAATATPTDVGADVGRALTIEQFFDALAVRLDGPRAGDRRLVLNWAFADAGEEWVLTLDHNALSALRGRQDSAADATIRLTRAAFDRIMVDRADPAAEFASGAVKVEGDPMALGTFLGLLDEPDPAFGVVTP